MISGLLATGKSGKWWMDLDQESTGFSLQIQGPQLYLSFALDKEETLNQALEFLTHFDREAHKGEDWEIGIGTFNGNIVSLILDNEYDDRLFLLIGKNSGNAMRYTFCGEDFRELANCLADLINGLEN